MDDARGALDQLLRQQVRHAAQGDMDRHRNDGEQLAPQHHHRQRRLAALSRGERGQELGMPRMGEADPGQHELGDGVGHDRRGGAGAHEIDGGGDRFDDGAGIGRIRRAGRGRHLRAARQRQHRQRPGKHLDGVVGLDLGHGYRQAETVGGGFEEIGVADELERRHPRSPRSRHAASAISGPIPEGSPRVRASGRSSEAMGDVYSDFPTMPAPRDVRDASGRDSPAASAVLRRSDAAGPARNPPRPCRADASP